ncbi:MAG: hypothetical protein HW388_889 [Dehalococcoidia bacterium]|nr:hypothetical protein [Dehalococcoidia bacterium]
MSTSKPDAPKSVPPAKQDKTGGPGVTIGNVAAAFAPGMGGTQGEGGAQDEGRAQAQAVGGIIFVLAVIGLVIAIVNPGDWKTTVGTVPLAVWERILVVMAALVLVTTLSYIPLMIFRTFTARQLKQLKEDWEEELKSHSWNNLAKRIGDVVERKYSLDRYNYPLLLTFCTALGGWLLVLLSNGFQPLIDLVDRGNVSDFLGQLSLAHPVAIGFLGAYTFSLGLLVRGYFRGDLSPNLLMQASYRMWEVMLITLVAGTVWVLLYNVGDAKGAENASADPLKAAIQLGTLQPAERANLMAAVFLAGFISPSLLINWMVRAAGLVQKRFFVPQVPEEHLLRNLDGMTPYTQARLAEAGIENVQNLAMADIADTIVTARLGSFRIVDWIDQALIRLPAENYMPVLTKMGIRTATDFILAFTRGGFSDPSVPPEPSAAILGSLKEILENTDIKDSNGNVVAKEPEEVWKQRLTTWALSIIEQPNYVRVQKLRDESRNAAVKFT